MCHSSIFSYPLCFFLYFLLVIPTQSSALSADLINKTCQKCSDESIVFSYNFCITSLQAIPVSHATNLEGLAVIAMELALENATNTVSSIKEKLNNASFDPYSIACLEDCLELYSNGVMTLLDSIEAFFSEHYGIASLWMSAVMEAATTCEGGFIEKEGEVSPLKEENYNLFQLCDIAICIIHWLTLAVPT